MQLKTFTIQLSAVEASELMELKRKLNSFGVQYSSSQVVAQAIAHTLRTMK